MAENKNSKFLALFNSKRATFILTAVLLVVINILAASFFLKLDLTSSKAYTLLNVSKNTISEIQDPIAAKAFFTKDLPAAYNDIEQYVRDILQEYARASHGKFTYEFYDMDEQENKEIAASYGVLPLEIYEFKNDRQEKRIAYMGMALIYGNMIDRIDGIQSTAGVEYQITTKIRKMISKQNILAGLEQKGKVTFYKSAAFSDFEIQDFDKSEQIVKAAFDKLDDELSGVLEFEVVDPAPQDVEQLSKQYGMKAYVINEDKNAAGEVTSRTAGLLSLLVSIDGKTAVVDPLARSLFGVGFSKPDVIYDKLNTSIEGLVSANPRVAYMMGNYENDLSDQKSGAGAAYLNKFASQLYDLDILVLNAEVALQKNEQDDKPTEPEAYEIPENIRTLIINSPKTALSETELFKIDQFLMRGGSVVILADAFRQQQVSQDYPPIFLPIDNGLGDWLKKKGLTLDSNLVLDDNSLPNQGANGQNGQMPKLYWVPMLDKETMNQDNPITANLNKVLSYYPSSITVDEDVAGEKGIEITELIKSSPKSWTMEGQINMNNAFPPAEDAMQQHTLAVLAEGSFESTFDAVPESLADNPLWQNKQVIKKSINPGKILLVGGAQIFGDMVLSAAPQILRTNEQQYLLQNMIDYMNGNGENASLRTKGRGINTLRESKDITRKLLRIFTIGFIPFLVVLSGFIVWMVRSSRRKRLKTIYGNGGQEE